MRTRTSIGLILFTLIAMAAETNARAPELVVTQIRALPGSDLPAQAGPSLQASCPTTSRATADRADASQTASLVHVVYLVPADSPDQGLDTNGTLDCSVRAMNQWFQQQTGNTLRWRIDTFTSGGVPVTDVTYIKSDRAGSFLNGAGEVSAELARRGFNLARKRYLTYVASNAGGVCGDAFYPISIGNGPSDGKYSQVYLDSAAGCGARQFGTPGAPSFAEVIVAQEMIHNDGIVAIGAPHGCGPFGIPAHVCTPGLWLTNLDPERTDIMFPFVGVPLSSKVLDRGHDDYFGQLNPLARGVESSAYLEAV